MSERQPGPTQATPPETPFRAAEQPATGHGGRQPKRVAVIAVHGVADQKPNESARSVAQLLAGIDREGLPRYEILKEETFHLPVRPLWDRRSEQGQTEAPAPALPLPWWKRVLRWMADVIAAAVAFFLEPFNAIAGSRRRSSIVGEDPAAPRINDLSLHLMNEQLRNYQGSRPSDTYTFPRIRTRRRRERPDEQTVEVDIHEMYWADLSRLRNSLWRIATEFYQLLFHLANVGGMLVDHESVRQGTDGWKRYGSYHGLAVGILTTLVPLQNLFMLGTILTLAVIGIPPGAIPGLLAFVFGIGAAAVVDFGIARRTVHHSVSRMLVPILAGIVLAMATHRLFDSTLSFQWRYYALALVWIGLAGALGAAIVRVFDRHQPGVREVSYGLMALWLATVAFMTIRALLPPHVPYGSQLVLTVSLWTLDVFFQINGLAWLVFLALLGGLMTGGWQLGRGDAPTSDARRTILTARITLVVPALGVLFVTLFTWLVLHKVFEGQLRDRVSFPVLLSTAGQPTMTVAEYMHGLIALSMSSGLVPMLVVVAAALVITLWTLLPIVWAEIRPPAPRPSLSLDDDDSEHLGRRLSTAYRTAALSGVLLGLALGIYCLATLVDLGVLAGIRNAAAVDQLLKAFRFDPDQTNEVVTTVGAFLGVSALGLLALEGRLRFLALGLKPVLDIALDVDNYLRLHPRESNPRARIAERYVSLLEWVFGRGSSRESERRYDAVVIIAHSQGTVITADLLRYVRNQHRLAANLSYEFAPEDDRWDSSVPIYLFTMGSPLRQLYRQRFPALYQWVGPATADDRLQLPPSSYPPPMDLGVQRWVNAYRSGDYVGRNLWFDEVRCRAVHRRVDATPGAAQPRRRRTDKGRAAIPDLHLAEDVSGRRRECCIGAGAHTHYWDNTAPDIAAMLDDLIAEAAGMPATNYA